MGSTQERPLAVVTGGSSGIGLALAQEFAGRGFDLIVAAEDAAVHDAADRIAASGAAAVAVQADLATFEGVERLWEVIAGTARPVDAVALNAGVGVGGEFATNDLGSELNLIDLNVRSAVHLARRVLPGMVERGAGRLLFTASIASTAPEPYLATYGASKAFVYSFAEALRAEVKDAGVTVTALMPGPTDTEFFERAELQDTKLGQSDKDDPADVARDGVEALLAGKDHIVAGSAKNKVQAAASSVLPRKAAAAVHGRMSEPGSGSSE